MPGISKQNGLCACARRGFSLASIAQNGRDTSKHLAEGSGNLLHTRLFAGNPKNMTIASALILQVYGRTCIVSKREALARAQILLWFKYAESDLRAKT